MSLYHNPIPSLILRGMQIIFGVVILALSISLVKGQLEDSAPLAQTFGTFVGVVVLVAGLLGLAAEWGAENLQGRIGILLDAGVMVAGLAGGLIMAIGIQLADCNDQSARNMYQLWLNTLFNRGCRERAENRDCSGNVEAYVTSRCKQCKADAAFMFLASVVLLVCLLFSYLRMRRGS
ncbi:hypothetical protein DM02DRAFT_582397 [Periconia macrospinosa]|uniref:MARVEL domain-containing protein n=1 Tax=Periconia macrospinosa TaxID=97972 RepID=A0A2V1E8U0_9PLEO|nr:hypothetical protein DM02DRAFT_582397 [Periconia macrospinosa]